MRLVRTAYCHNDPNSMILYNYIIMFSKYAFQFGRTIERQMAIHGSPSRSFSGTWNLSGKRSYSRQIFAEPISRACVSGKLVQK